MTNLWERRQDQLAVWGSGVRVPSAPPTSRPFFRRKGGLSRLWRNCRGSRGPVVPTTAGPGLPGRCRVPWSEAPGEQCGVRLVQLHDLAEREVAALRQVGENGAVHRVRERRVVDLLPGCRLQQTQVLQRSDARLDAGGAPVRRRGGGRSGPEPDAEADGGGDEGDLLEHGS